MRVTESRPSVASLLRAQAAALVAIADALDAEQVPADPSPELVSLRDTGLPLRSLRAAIRAGELVAHRIGRAHYLRRDELAGWVASRRVQPDVERSEQTAPSTEGRPSVALDDAIERALAKGRLRVVGSASRK